MVRPIPIHVGHDQYFCPTPLAIGLLISVSVLVAFCAQHSRKVPSNPPRRSPLPSSKNFIEDTNSHKSDHPLINPRRNSEESEVEKIYNNPDHEEGGLWQKAILMGEKCQPPEFSGVLFYDSYGNRISDLPRSPRAIRTTPMRNFSSLAQNNQ